LTENDIWFLIEIGAGIIFVLTPNFNDFNKTLGEIFNIAAKKI